ncbi:MAG: inositol monophosphatase family protein, partial [Candidatus Puniceispirillaceae bacterium]
MRTADTAALVSDKAVLLILKQVSEEIILPRYKRLSDADISTKTDANDFVTVADREAEADISSKLLRMLPGSRCIGEESVAEGRCDITTSDANYTWIVDPIDGTRNFVAGEEHF